MTVSQLLVTVSFADDAGNDESLTSEATSAVTCTLPANGIPAVLQKDHLDAATAQSLQQKNISDTSRLPAAAHSFQAEPGLSWSEIAGAWEPISLLAIPTRDEGRPQK